MGLDNSAAFTWVQKFSWMPFFPKDNVNGVEALVQAFMECAQDEHHARRIVDRIQQSDERSPMPSRILSVAVETVPRTNEFVPRKRHPDEMPFTGKGIYSLWTEDDVQRHERLLHHTKRDTREYAKQALAGWKQYCDERGFVAHAEPYTPQGHIHPYREDVRCHVCNDTGWQYANAAINYHTMSPGIAKACVCRPVNTEDE